MLAIITLIKTWQLTDGLRRWRAVGIMLLLLGFGPAAHAYNLTVDRAAPISATNFHTVQGAINAAPLAQTTPYTIFIRNGKYKEKITVASGKAFLQLVGESIGHTILTFDDFSGKPMPGGGTFGTSTSASVTINAPDFAAFNITFENSTGESPQALAISVTSDRVVFKNCRFLGGQDTVLANGNGNRQYFRDCYIDGTVDFIFGGSRAVFERCVIYPKTRLSGAGSSYITAANTQPGQAYGYVLRGCTIAPNRGGTVYYLGRPWQNSTGSVPPAQNKVVWLKTRIGSNVVRSEGWSTWDAGTDTNLITFAEYAPRTFRNTAVNVSSRVAWSRQLTAADTTQYTVASLFGTWNPCAVAVGVCSSFTPDIVTSNFTGIKGSSLTTFTWNASWAIAGVQYELMRSATRRGTYAPVAMVTAANDTIYNFQTTDALPVAGSRFYYYLRASKTGLATHFSDTLDISRVPTINVVGAAGNFAQYSNGPSASRNYSVSGANVTGSITITAPANFEISTNGTTWNGSTTPVTLPQTNNTVAGTTISIRLNAAVAGSYSGNILHSSPGATDVLLPVTGTKVNTPQPISNILQMWSLRVSNADSAALRSANAMVSAPVLRRLSVSNGTAVAAVPAYSARYGQAVGASANGDGTWTAAAGGPGGTLNRGYYEQFTVTATGAGRALRLDSLLLWSAFYGSNSNTKLAVVWSRSGFASDSADVVSGSGPGGGFLSTANGGFATPVVLNNQSSGVNQYYHFALSNTPLQLLAGQTLTLRVYRSCGSGSAGRYGLLRDVKVKGEALTATAIRNAKGRASLLIYPNPTTDQLTAAHPAASAGASLTVYALDGHKVATVPSTTGSTETRVAVGRLAVGTYLLRYTDATMQQTAIFTKE